MTTISGAAAITGAASGIGRALAIELAARGCDLALADRDDAGLAALATEITRNSSQKVTIHRGDVGEPKQIEDFAQAAIAGHPGLNIVVNNAGVALMGTFDEIDQVQMDWLMNINFWGVVHGTRAFLPHLATRREAHIVNVSSSASSRRRGKRPMPRRNSRYAASRKPCGTSCRWRAARFGSPWCIPAGSPPTSPAIPAPAPG